MAGDRAFRSVSVVDAFLSARQVAQTADNQEWCSVGPTDLCDGGRFHVKAVGLPDSKCPLAVLAVVEEHEAGDSVAPDRQFSLP